jgi:RHS repeat-associated protein
MKNLTFNLHFSTPSTISNGLKHCDWGATFAGISNKRIYTPRLQPCRMAAGTSGTLPVLCGDTAHGNLLDLGYDFHLGNGATGSGADNGNVFGLTNYKDSTRSQTFTYDALNRLTSAQNSGTDCSVLILQNKTKFWGNSYVYDAWGNLLQKNITKCNAEYLVATADAQNRIHVPTPDYVYDAAGNMNTDVTDGVTAVYDQENRVSTATSSGVNTTYTYDSDGSRVRKSTGNLAANGTLYWYMAPGVVAETDLAGTTNSEYVFFGGERVARRDGATGTGGVFYYFSDHLKTASVITDSAGVIKAESDYYPWGGELQFVNNDSNHYKFTGKERDGESGLDYFGARYYSNALGKFISADWSDRPAPIPYANLDNPQSLNLYRYPSNPESYPDPDGHCTDDSHKSHNIFWCVAHWAGYFQSDAEKQAALKKQADDARKQLSELNPKKLAINGKTPQQFAATATNQQAVDALRAVVEYIAAQVQFPVQCPEGVSCGIVFPIGEPYGDPALGFSRAVATNEELSGILRNLFQDSDKLPGGTAGAVRYEIRTGIRLSPAYHFQDAADTITELNNFLKRNPGLSAHDQALTKALIQDLQNALANKP